MIGSSANYLSYPKRILLSTLETFKSQLGVVSIVLAVP